MNWLKDLLKEQGVELSDEAMNAIKAELPKHFKPADEFNARGTEIESLKAQLAQRDTDLKELKKATEKDSDLAAQLSDLQKKYETDTKDLTAKMADLELTNAIKLFVTKDSKDADIVSSLIDKTKVTKKDDGSYTGIDDQVKALREAKPFLFNEDNGYQPANGGTPNPNTTFDFGFTNVNSYGNSNGGK